jgi:trans-aconitate 2-methyltransferase
MPEADSVVASVRENLKPEGLFVLEMGAKGNIRHMLAALESVLRDGGFTPRNPWYFPSAAEYAGLLEKHGFEIAGLWTFDRPSELEHPEKGLREWLEMFAGAWFEGVPAAARNGLVFEIEARLKPVLFTEGRWWMDYRRLRVVARRV